MHKKTSASYLETQATELAIEFRQAIRNGEIFKNVKKIYRKLKRVQKELQSCAPLEKVEIGDTY
jgi:hypothetical protein